MKTKKLISLILCLAMIFSLCGNGLVAFAEEGEESAPQVTEEPAETAAPAEENGENEEEPAGEPEDIKDKAERIVSSEETTIERMELEDPSELRAQSGVKANEMAELIKSVKIDDDEMVRVFITLEEPSVIESTGSAAATISNFARIDRLKSEQSKVIASIESEVLEGKSLDVRYQYGLLLNGFAATVRYGDIRGIRAIDGVKGVLLQRTFHTTAVDEIIDEDPESGIAPMSNSDGPMIGREDAWESTGAYGAGLQIAVIDTGIDLDHPSFAPLSESQLTETSSDESTIENVLNSLHVHEKSPSVTASQLYRSTKVPFGYNYVDESLRIDHADNEGDHGTHVSGIAAANRLDTTEVVGVAPEAQIYTMKVFGTGGGAYDEDIMAAIEDALLLGADVINMSLGSPAGFTSDGEEIDRVYNKVSAAGVILAASAGNEGGMGENNFWGTGTNLTSNPDNGTAGSPATYGSSLSVASVNNIGQTGYYVEVADTKYIYIDTSAEYINDAMTTLAEGGPYDFVAVPNNGQSAADFAGVSGKIALVQRGVSAFTDKCALADAAGAVACIVYNNTTGTISMDLSSSTSTIPCVSITQAAGEAIIAAKQADPSVLMEVSSEEGKAPTDDGYTMSDFSSWGVAPDLSLKPDITAPGGNIYSSLDGGNYGTMSGTSMAAPNLAGVSALVVQHVKSLELGLEGAELNAFVSSLLMSTAVPLACGDEGLYYSPRQQGSGLANAGLAVTTGVTLTVDGKDRPKAELRDDPAKNGTYTVSFSAENFGEHNAYYDLRTVVQTEDYFTDDSTGESKNFIALSPKALEASNSVTKGLSLTYDYDENTKTNSHDAYLLWTAGEVDEADFFRYDLVADKTLADSDTQAYLDALVGKSAPVDLADQVAVVKKGDSTEFSVVIQVAQSGKDYMDEIFPNGIFVDGFTFLENRAEDGVDLSIPFLAFYGDWTRAPAIDSAFVWDPYGMGESDVPTGSQYYNMLLTPYSYEETVPGINGWITDEPYDPRHMSLSPDDQYSDFDYISDIYVSLLRNAKTLSITYTDESGKVLHTKTLENVPKSCRAGTTTGGATVVVPFVYSDYAYPYEMYQMTGADGQPLPEGSVITLTVEAELDYEPGDDRTSADLNNKWVTDITIDNTAPIFVEEADGGMDFSFYTLKDQPGQVYLGMMLYDLVGVSAGLITDSYGYSLYEAFAMPDDDETAVYDEDGVLLYDIAGVTVDDLGVVYEAFINVTKYAGQSISFLVDDYASNGPTGYRINNVPAPEAGGDTDDDFYTFTDSAYSAAAYDDSEGLVYAIGKEDGALYAVQPVSGKSVKLTESKLVDTAELDSDYQVVGMAASDGELSVLLDNGVSSGSKYIYKVDKSKTPYTLAGEAAYSFSYLSNPRALAYAGSRMSFWYKGIFGGQLVTVCANDTRTNTLVNSMSVSANATASTFDPESNTLYVAFDNGALYSWTITFDDEYYLDNADGTEKQVAETGYGDALAISTVAFHDGTLPEGVGGGDEPAPSGDVAVFSSDEYSVAAYDDVNGLIYAVSKADKCLYAVLPDGSASEKLTQRDFADGRTLTGLACCDGQLLALTESGSNAFLYEVTEKYELDFDSRIVLNYCSSPAGLTTVGDADTLVFGYRPGGNPALGIRHAGNASTGAGFETLDYVDSPFVTGTYDADNELLYCVTEDGKLTAYTLYIGYGMAYITASTEVAASGYANALAIHVGAFKIGKLPSDVEAPAGEFAVFTSSEYEYAAYDANEGLVYALDKDGYLYAVLPDGSDSVKLTDEPLVNTDVTLPSQNYKAVGLAADNGKLKVLYCNGGTKSWVYDVDKSSVPYKLSMLGRIEIGTVEPVAPVIVGSKVVFYYDDNFLAQTDTYGITPVVYTPTAAGVSAVAGTYDGVDTLYMAYANGALYSYKLEINSYTGRVSGSDETLVAGSGYANALAIYKGAFHNGTLPEGVTEGGDEPAPSTGLSVFYNASYSVATYDPTPALVYAIGATDGALYAVQPNSGESVKLSEPNLGYSSKVTGLASNRGFLCAMFADGAVYEIDTDNWTLGERWCTVSGATGAGPMAWIDDNLYFFYEPSAGYGRIGCTTSAGSIVTTVFWSVAPSCSAISAYYNTSDGLLYVAYADGSLYSYDMASSTETLVSASGYGSVIAMYNGTMYDGELPSVPGNGAEEPKADEVIDPEIQAPGDADLDPVPEEQLPEDVEPTEPAEDEATEPAPTEEPELPAGPGV